LIGKNVHNYKELSNGTLINKCFDQLDEECKKWQPFDNFDYLKTKAEIEQFSCNNWTMVLEKMKKLKAKHNFTDLQAEFNQKKVLNGDSFELNKLILKIMTLYSKLNEEELIATLCTMEIEY
jgi:ASC-1-like (ASCH) protein